MNDMYSELLPLLHSPSRDPIRERAPTPGGRCWSFCPAHADGTKYGKRSLSLHSVYGLNCFAGCAFRDIVRALRGGTFGPRVVGTASRTNGKARPLSGEIVAAWVYTNALGRALFRVVRIEGPDGKRYAQQHPDGRGGWAWGRNNAPRVLYRLPALIIAPPDDPAFVCEGEKCADALAALGVTATTSPEGAGNWRDEYAAELRGRHVVILPDADEPGERHAGQVARSLAGVAASISIVRLPDLPPKGDAVDWIAAGGTRDALLRLAGLAERALLEAVLA